MDLKTARQNNAPQVGESEFKPNPPSALEKMPNPTDTVSARQNPPAIAGKPWTLRDLKDTRQNVREAVEAAAFVPPGAKAMLVEIIDQTFPQARLLSLDAHLHIFPRGNKQTADFCLTISEL